MGCDTLQNLLTAYPPGSDVAATTRPEAGREQPERPFISDTGLADPYGASPSARISGSVKAVLGGLKHWSKQDIQRVMSRLPPGRPKIKREEVHGLGIHGV